VVSYDPSGYFGGVWILDKNDDSADGDWERSYLLSPDGDGVDGEDGGGGAMGIGEGDQLGWSVSASGNAIIVGSPGYMGSDVPNIDGSGWDWRGAGRVFALSRNDTDGSWGGVDAVSIISPSQDGEDGLDDHAGFGNSVDVSDCGCLVAIGAWHDRDSRGSAYVYEREYDGDGDGGASSWRLVQKFAPDDTRRSQSEYLHGNYGYSVSLSNDGSHLAVKAPYDSYLGSYDYVDPVRGVTYVYRRGSDGKFGGRQSLCTPEGAQVESHHRDVVFVDDYLLVGSPGRNRVYVFRRDDNTGDYVPDTVLIPSDAVVDGASDFGIRIDGNGAEAMIADLRGGRSYLFANVDGLWTEKAIFETSSSGSVISSYGGTIVEHSPQSFVSDGEVYSGTSNFYDLVCER
jgi:hypothetical protein